MPSQEQWLVKIHRWALRGQLVNNPEVREEPWTDNKLREKGNSP